MSGSSPRRCHRKRRIAAEMTRRANPLNGWRLDPAAIRDVGHDLSRPECILAERDGSQTLVVPASQAAASPNLFEGTLPNGLAFARNGDLLIANFGTDTLDVMTREGKSRVLYDSIDGSPLGKVNFVLRDSKDRLWI